MLALLDAGFQEWEVEQIMGGNFRRFLTMTLGRYIKLDPTLVSPMNVKEVEEDEGQLAKGEETHTSVAFNTQL